MARWNAAELDATFGLGPGGSGFGLRNVLLDGIEGRGLASD